MFKSTGVRRIISSSSLQAAKKTNFDLLDSEKTFHYPKKFISHSTPVM